jgi:hypothetical protein
VNGAPHGPRPLVIEARRMSVTDELLSASTVAFPEFARTLERFRIQGHLDAEYRIDPGSPRPALTVLLSNGTIAYQGLAVPFTDAAARLDSDGARIELTDFRGRLGPGVVRGGSYSGRPGGAAALRLQVDGVDLAHGGQPFGADLDVLNPVWQTLHPAGRANVSVNLDWGDGEAPTAVDVSATLTGAHFQLAELPFAFEETVGTVRWRDGRLDVSEVQARAGHGEVRVRTGWATFLPEGRAGHLELSGRGLPMLETLRPILPAASRKRLEGLHTSGELDVVQFTLGFDLPLNGPGKARGAGLLVFHGVSIQPGLRLSELEGPMVLEQVEVDGDRFEARGRLAGVHLRVGRVDLHDLKADLELKSGTIRFSSPTATLLRGSLCDNPDARQAAYFWARTEPPGEFSGTFGFRDVELGQLLPALDVGGEATEEPLSGRISGSVEFGSRGEDVLGGLEGKGRVMLERGYLGAVPLLVGLLNVFQIPRTADFTGGRIDFQIRDRAVELSTVEIRSRPMDLVGAGRCTFAGELDITLDPRFNLPLVPRVKIPILGELWSALKSEIYYVHVVGEIDDPQTRVVVSPFKIGDDEPGRKSTRPAGRIDRQIPKRF